MIVEESLGARIRARRRALGYTQEQFAHEAGVTMNYVARLERGEIGDPHVSTLSAIARAGGVPTSELLGEEQRPLAQAPPEATAEERRLKYLRSWRAFVWKLVQRWEESPPESEREISVVLDTMQALLDEGAFERPPEEITVRRWSEASEWTDLQFLFRGIDRLNQIADSLQTGADAKRRHTAFKVIKGYMSA